MCLGDEGVKLLLEFNAQYNIPSPPAIPTTARPPSKALRGPNPDPADIPSDAESKDASAEQSTDPAILESPDSPDFVLSDSDLDDCEPEDVVYDGEMLPPNCVQLSKIPPLVEARVVERMFDAFHDNPDYRAQPLEQSVEEMLEFALRGFTIGEDDEIRVVLSDPARFPRNRRHNIAHYFREFADRCVALDAGVPAIRCFRGAAKLPLHHDMLTPLNLEMLMLLDHCRDWAAHRLQQGAVPADHVWNMNVILDGGWAHHVGYGHMDPGAAPEWDCDDGRPMGLVRLYLLRRLGRTMHRLDGAVWADKLAAMSDDPYTVSWPRGTKELFDPREEYFEVNMFVVGAFPKMGRRRRASETRPSRESRGLRPIMPLCLRRELHQ